MTPKVFLVTGAEFTPRWTTRQAFDDFVHSSGKRPVVNPAVFAGLERRLGEPTHTR